MQLIQYGDVLFVHLNTSQIIDSSDLTYGDIISMNIQTENMSSDLQVVHDIYLNNHKIHKHSDTEDMLSDVQVVYDISSVSKCS